MIQITNEKDLIGKTIRDIKNINTDIRLILIFDNSYAVFDIYIQTEPYDTCVELSTDMLNDSEKKRFDLT